MTLRRYLVLAVLIFSFGVDVNAADRKEIKRKVGELNTQSIELLGVSLNAVRYLVDASPTNYLLLSHLEQSGEISFIRELEAKQYVKLQIVQGLPDGSERNERFLRVIPVGDGIELQQCVLALQHNPTLQRTPNSGR